MPPKKPRHFIFVTKDFSGLAYPKKLREQGEEVLLAFRADPDEGEKTPPGYKLVGRGITDRIELDELWKVRAKYKNSYWLFDQNHFFKEGEALRREGFKRVFGGQHLTYRMEHDRDFGVALTDKAGLKSPDTFDFKEVIQGIQHLDQNPDKAYVFKPNETGNGWDTFVPDSEKDNLANDELHAYLESLPTGNAGGYILQERIKGVEANFELWMYEGTPYFAICDLECKKKHNDDFGGLCGGAQDISFALPMKSKAIRETIEKLLVLPEFKRYTGFLDMNVIIADNGPYFLEFCARFGYPCHISILYGLAKAPLGDILAQMIDGNQLKGFYENFKYGFGAGITMYIESPRKGLPLYVPEDVEPHFAPYDTYKRGDLTLIGGTGVEVGTVVGHGFTIMDAAEEAMIFGKKIAYPNRDMRTDLDKDTYASNPRDRYLALEAMRYLVE